tara:strand:+ start:2670 stop:3035 length:366 start_codon:yes stop_codon:yes gene_type:complete
MAKRFKIVATREIDAYRFEYYEIEASNEKQALTLLKEGMVEPFQVYPYVAAISPHRMVEDVQGVIPSKDKNLAKKIDEVFGEGHYYPSDTEEEEKDYADGEENLKDDTQSGALPPDSGSGL